MRTPRTQSRPGASILMFAVLSSCATGDGQTDRSALAPTTATIAVREPSNDILTTRDGGSDDAATPVMTATTALPNTTPSSISTSTTTTSPTSMPNATTTVATTTTAPPSSTIASASQPSPAGPSPCPPTGARIWEERPASDIPAPPIPDGWRVDSAGRSVQGRDLTVLVRPVDAPTRTVMVIGGIHGNEPVSPPAVRAMVDADIPPDTEVWLLPDLNPDGSAVGTRCNANGVDLNRNFSWGWRADTGGPDAFSEPESTAAAALVERVVPDLVVWVHQPLGYASSIGGTPDDYERSWARASGVPVRPDVSQHGGGESWTAFVAGISSMLIEVETYDARPDMVASHVAGFNALLDVVVPR